MFHTLFLVSMLLSTPIPALLRILPMKGWSNEVELQGCSPCQEERCPPVSPRCPAGRTKDQCGCCWECANVDGQMCDLPGTKTHFGTCGEELRCQVKAGQKPLCVCPSQEPVCGSDRRTYKNICRLHEAIRSKRRAVLSVAHTGLCQEAPVLVSSPQDMVAMVGQTVVFGCDVLGQPIPDLHWRKDGIDRPLPGKSSHIIVQSWGGPQRNQVSSWLQIHNVHPRDAGLYTCHAQNANGELSISAQLSVTSSDFSQASDVSEHLFGVFDTIDDEDFSREGASGSHE
ncbi:kazal-type serine protease inhibitor domain-containing protein 1-like [Hyperolius riggenbachi]|uniref:kazal-type serine protease inhibitor domain-containing protein 1-like n=1 Tax=Hyperolius riggenbachi TaxID=752182 RepID=UPI0035A3A392